MKFCKDCTHLRVSVCTNPNLTYLDLVHGLNKQYYADNARSYDHLCGSDAKHFEPRIIEPLPDQPF